MKQNVSHFLAKLQSSALWDLRKEDAVSIFVTEKGTEELPITCHAMHLEAREMAIFLNINKF